MINNQDACVALEAENAWLRQRVAQLEHQAAEHVLSDSSQSEHEHLLHFLVEHIPAAVALFDNNMHYIIASRRWINEYGLDDRHIIGCSYYEVFPDTPEHIIALHQRCLHGAVEHGQEETLLQPDGRTEWINWEVRPWYNNSGTIGGLLLCTEMATAWKQMQEAVHKSEERFQTLIDTIRVAILIHKSGYFCYANHAAETILGYTK